MAAIAPQLGIGEPFVPPPAYKPRPPQSRILPNGDQIIREKVEIVGTESGTVYSTASEGGRDELISIRPIGAPLDKQREPGMQEALTGQDLLAQGLDPNDPATQAQIQSGQLNYGNASQVVAANQPQGGTPAGTIAPQPVNDPVAAQHAAAQTTINAQMAANTAQTTALGADRGVINAQAATIGPQNRQLDASGNVLNARAGTIAPQRDVIAAQGNVVNAQTAQTQGQRGFIGQQQGANTARTTEEQGVQAAARNTADQAAIAQAQNSRDNEDYKYALAGLSRPREIQTAEGDDVQGLPPGVRGKLETQEQILTRVAGANERLRALALEGAQLAVQLLGTDVAAAQQAAARAGLTLDEAQLLVQQAQITEGQAGLDVDRSQIGVQEARNTAGLADIDARGAGLEAGRAGLLEKQAGQTSKPGMTVYQNPFDGSSKEVTPAEKARLDALDDQQIEAQNPGLKAWTDPQTGNRELVTPDEYNRRQADYERDFGISRQKTRYGPDQLGAFSNDYILTLIANGEIPRDALSMNGARQILLGRGLTGQQVDIMLADAIRRFEAKATSGPGNTDLSGLFGGG